jgi:hypothetical protein
VSLVLDEGDDHAVEVEEEHDEVETELCKGFLLAVRGDGHKNCGIPRTFLWTFSFRKISVASRRCVLSTILS